MAKAPTKRTFIGVEHMINLVHSGRMEGEDAIRSDLRELLRAVKSLARSPAEEIQRQLEDDLEIVQRHVREGEARIARQRKIVERHRAEGLDSSLSEEVLQNFEEGQANRIFRLMTLRWARRRLSKTDY